MVWIGLIRLRVGSICWALENTVLCLLVTQEGGNFLTIWVTVSLSGRNEGQCCMQLVRVLIITAAWWQRSLENSCYNCFTLRVRRHLASVTCDVRCWQDSDKQIHGFKVVRVKCFIFDETVVWACVRVWTGGQALIKHFWSNAKLNPPCGLQVI